MAPDFVKDGPNGSAIVDPAKVPTPEAKKEEAARPEWLPEKFKSPEDLAAAYKELETKLGRPVSPVPAPTIEEVKAKGIDVDALTREYAEKGALSPESLKALETAGFSQTHVTNYVEGLKAKQAQTRQEFAEVAGGEEHLVNVLKWAETNLPAEEQKAYNALLEANNMVAAKIMLKDIAGRYTAAAGEAPELVDAEPIPGAAGIKPFGSQAEVIAAMNDPRYKQGDPAYHRKVQMRLSISDF